jgi:hypothetical protein
LSGIVEFPLTFLSVNFVCRDAQLTQALLASGADSAMADVSLSGWLDVGTIC